jgi:hypothetical protein
MFIYGRSSRYYRAAPAARMLTRSERIELFRRTIRSEQCSLSDRARLFTALALGVGLHLVGRWCRAGLLGRDAERGAAASAVRGGSQTKATHRELAQRPSM